MVKYMDNAKPLGFDAWNSSRQAGKKSGLRTLLIWVAVFFLTWWLFSSWLTTNKVDTMPVDAPMVEMAAGEDLSHIPVQILNNEKISAKVQGLRISNIILNNYKADKSADGNVKLLAADKEFMEIGLLATGTSAPVMDTNWTYRGKDNFSWKNADGIEFVRTYSSDNYLITVRDEIKNKSKRDVSFAPYARIVKSEIEKSQTGVAAGGIAFSENNIEREDWADLSKKSYAYQTNAGFVGFETQYWETVASVFAPDQTLRIRQRTDGMYQADVAAAAVYVPAGASASFETKLYAGPKTQEDLKYAAENLAGLDRTIDYGWFWFLARPFLWALNALFAFVGNYGVAIILLTIILRLLMWPLTRKSYTSMAAMQKMQPKMQRIQKLYSGDKLRLQQEMMKLYQTHKTSPMSGCLPMLLQIPIFFALYKALLISVPMRGAGFLWIPDLSRADPTSIFNLFGLLPFGVPGWLVIGILPIIMGITMWYQQHLQSANNNVAAMDNNPVAGTMKMMKWMPFIFVFMFAWMPAGLVLYWTVSNMVGILQTYLIKRSKK